MRIFELCVDSNRQCNLSDCPFEKCSLLVNFQDILWHLVDQNHWKKEGVELYQVLNGVVDVVGGHNALGKLTVMLKATSLLK